MEERLPTVDPLLVKATRRMSPAKRLALGCGLTQMALDVSRKKGVDGWRALQQAR
jgi:hypothetical protein